MIKQYLQTSSLGISLLRTYYLPIRVKASCAYLFRYVKNYSSFLVNSREIVNYTYELDSLNIQYLASLVAVVTSRPLAEIEGYLQEIAQDAELIAELKQSFLNSRYRYQTDVLPRFGRRMGWYAFVRALKPKTVIETGVEKGLGSTVIARALQKNSAEGFSGKVYSLDINPKAGFLVPEQLKPFVSFKFGDAITTLQNWEAGPVDLFINDSDHCPHYEYNEYQTMQKYLSSQAIILGDNAHATDSLYRFAKETNRKFVFFQERPQHHFHPGAGIGVAYW